MNTEYYVQLFTGLLYDDNDTIAVVTINNQTNKRKQKILKVNEFVSYAKHLQRLNEAGFNIYASVNRLKENATTRRKDDYRELQHTIFLDFDAKATDMKNLFLKLHKEIENGNMPEPTLIVRTSEGNHQLYFVLEHDIEFHKISLAMQGLNEFFKLDHTHDISRISRVPGFYNQKPGKEGFPVMAMKNIVLSKDKSIVVRSTCKRIDVLWVDRIIENYPVENTERIKVEKKVVKLNETEYRDLEDIYNNARNDYYKSQSERDMAFCVYCLSNNIADSDTLISFLAQKRMDKANPSYYANLTVSKAMNYVSMKQAPQ